MKNCTDSDAPEPEKKSEKLGLDGASEWPFRVEECAELGKYCVATQNIKPFQTVIYDQSLVFGPSDFNDPCCLICLEALDNVDNVCPLCNIPMCASEKCQANAGIHEPECLIFRQHQPEKLKVELDSLLPSPVYSLVVPLRLLSLREKEPERWKLAMNLVSHFDDHEAHNNDKVEYILATSMPILENCGVSKEDIRLIAHLMGILWTNAVTLPRLIQNQNEPLGHALFPLFSRLEHNCSSNCRVTVTADGRFVTVRAVRHISEGEHLSIDYTNPLLGNLTRRKDFFGHWQFNCHCQRCCSPTEMDTYLSAVRCPDRDGYLLPVQPTLKGSVWQCDRCGKTQEEKWVEERTDKFKSLWGSPIRSTKNPSKTLKEMGSKMNLALSLSEWEDYLATLSNELHPNHWIVMNVKLVIIQLLSSDQENEKMENIQRAVELCENYVGVYEKISPGYTKWRGHILELQSAALLKKSQLQPGGDFVSLKRSLLMLKEATKCRQYEPQENIAMLGFLLKSHSKALSSILNS